jgi:hypothetical protein
VWIADARRFGNVDDIAKQGQRRADTDGIAVHRGDHRLTNGKNVASHRYRVDEQLREPVVVS